MSGPEMPLDAARLLHAVSEERDRLKAELASAVEIATAFERERDAALEKIRRLESDKQRMNQAFGEFDAAIESAQRAHHNYQEWGPEEYGPIDAARNEFYRKEKP